MKDREWAKRERQAWAEGRDPESLRLGAEIRRRRIAAGLSLVALDHRHARRRGIDHHTDAATLVRLSDAERGLLPPDETARILEWVEGAVAPGF